MKPSGNRMLVGQLFRYRWSSSIDITKALIRTPIVPMILNVSRLSTQRAVEDRILVLNFPNASVESLLRTKIGKGPRYNGTTGDCIVRAIAIAMCYSACIPPENFLLI